MLGATGAVWLDADGDGKRTSAHVYAERLLKDADGDWRKVVPALTNYDEAVAAQVAGLLRTKGVSLRDEGVRTAAKKAGTHVERAFEDYAEAWRDSEVARDKTRKP